MCSRAALQGKWRGSPGIVQNQHQHRASINHTSQSGIGACVTFSGGFFVFSAASFLQRGSCFFLHCDYIESVEPDNRTKKALSDLNLNLNLNQRTLLFCLHFHSLGRIQICRGGVANETCSQPPPSWFLVHVHIIAHTPNLLTSRLSSAALARSHVHLLRLNVHADECYSVFHAPD